MRRPNINCVVEPDTMREIEALTKALHRTVSYIMRAALRTYMDAQWQQLERIKPGIRPPKPKRSSISKGKGKIRELS